METKERVRVDHDLLDRLLRSRDKYHMLSMLLGDMLKERGVNIDYLFEASKDEIAHELIRHRKKEDENVNTN